MIRATLPPPRTYPPTHVDRDAKLAHVLREIAILRDRYADDAVMLADLAGHLKVAAESIGAQALGVLCRQQTA